MSPLDLLRSAPDTHAEDEPCVICKRPLHPPSGSTETTYRLPECHHTFHTACVVAWFRTGDSRCPVCRNPGINHLELEKPLSVTKANHTLRTKEIFRYVKAHRESCSRYVVGLVDRWAQLQERVKKVDQETTEHNRRLRDEPMAFYDALKKKRALRKKRWAIRAQIRAVIRELHAVPLVPVIIPSFVDLE